jgi:hypothetical protein
VSTNLLAGLISVCMRATGQAASLTGQLERERAAAGAGPRHPRRVAGGSGGGWQDSGGLWPAIKLIEGVAAGEGDPEFGISAAACCPRTASSTSRDEIPETRAGAAADSWSLVHGGMAQNVGPILEMVTEKYLLRSRRSGPAARRRSACSTACSLAEAGRHPRVWASHHPQLPRPDADHHPVGQQPLHRDADRARARAFGADFWGFWMLGGMSGGGMGFIFDPARKRRPRSAWAEIMLRTKRELQHALPFAMEPVVYDFAINPHGTFATLLTGEEALMPSGYYADMAPRCCAPTARAVALSVRDENWTSFGAACRNRPELRGMVETLFERCSRGRTGSPAGRAPGIALLQGMASTAASTSQIRADLRSGRIGLAQNRLAASTTHRGRRGRRTSWTPIAAGQRRGLRLGEQPWPPARWPWSRWPPARAAAGPRAPAWSRRCIPSASWADGTARFIELHLAKSRKRGSRARRGSAPCLHHQLPDPRADVRAFLELAELRLPGR